MPCVGALRTRLDFFLVSALKSAASYSAHSLLSGEQLHALALKSGLHRSNVFVLNSLINFYAKHGHSIAAGRLFLAAPAYLLDTASWNIMIAMHARLGHIDDAREMFEGMPQQERDCVSFTTMIMGLAQNGRPADALGIFREMAAAGVAPNEVTLASVLSSCSHLRELLCGKMAHAVAVKRILDGHLLVSTNLVNLYAVCSSLSDSKAVFGTMPERNAVTWNAMLNGYAKAGFIDDARKLFKRMPVRDVVSWGTMVDGYLCVDRLEEALCTYREMFRQLQDAMANEVMVVDLVSACGRFSAIREGRQLHNVIIKTGLDSHAFVQATVIHFYAACREIELACSQFEAGSKDNVSSWNAMIAGLVRNGMVDAAKRLFDEMPERDVVSWSTLIAANVQNGQPNVALDLFQDMQIVGLEPNEITLASVLSAVASAGTLEQGKWIHDYIDRKSIPLTDNLSAGLIDMYAKHGSIRNAIQLFDQVRQSSTTVSPWNAIICGLAMHGHADESLGIFRDLERRDIRPNLITFLGVLSACCHAGLVATGKRYLESMQSLYRIEPSMKHYGCMVDLLARAGCLEEAEWLIESMPMEADVVIWGSVLAASRIHGKVEAGERAAANLARLDPSHGAGRVLLSNIYADTGRWNDVQLIRREMQNERLKKLPGYSGILS